MLNRRRFVYGILSVSALGSGFLGRAYAAQRTSLPSLHGRLDRDVFLALRHHTFTAVIEGRRVRFVLVNVSDDAGGAGSEQFTVLFRGPRDLPLKAGTTVFRHTTAGSVPLYVQAAPSDERATYYRAPFNLLS
jgi:uncharacterized protein DUF6916